jgi:hypothetical protein
MVGALRVWFCCRFRPPIREESGAAGPGVTTNSGSRVREQIPFGWQFVSQAEWFSVVSPPPKPVSLLEKLLEDLRPEATAKALSPMSGRLFAAARLPRQRPAAEAAGRGVGWRRVLTGVDRDFLLGPGDERLGQLKLDLVANVNDEAGMHIAPSQLQPRIHARKRIAHTQLN